MLAEIYVRFDLRWRYPVSKGGVPQVEADCTLITKGCRLKRRRGTCYRIGAAWPVRRGDNRSIYPCLDLNVKVSIDTLKS